MQPDSGQHNKDGALIKAEKHFRAYMECDITPYMLKRCYACFNPVIIERIMTVTDSNNRPLFQQMELFCEPCWQWVCVCYSHMAPYFGQAGQMPTNEQILAGKRKKELLN